MPCYDGRDEEDRREQGRERAFIDAALCGLLAGLEAQMTGNGISPFDLIDYKEAGINRKQLEKWWEHHKAVDTERRLREVREEKEREIRNKALAKLTAEEKRLLNLR